MNSPDPQSGDGAANMGSVDEQPTKRLVIGAALIAVVGLAAILTLPDSPVLESEGTSEELLVLSAIDEFMPDGQECVERLLSGDSPERGWEGWGGNGWETEINGSEELVVQITCDFDSQEFWFSHQLRIQYPLKTGEAAEVINSVVRSEVSREILGYFNESRDRYSELRLTDDEQRLDMAQHRGCGYPGYLTVSGVVTYANEGLFSVFLTFGQNNPCANNTFNPLVSMNFDLYGVPYEHGHRKPLMLFDLSDLFLDDSRWEAELADVVVRRWAESGSSPPEGIRETLNAKFISSLDFSMGTETLTLHSGTHTYLFPGWCCATNPDHLEIRYNELSNYLDSEGPYRHIAPGQPARLG